MRLYPQSHPSYSVAVLFQFLTVLFIVAIILLVHKTFIAV